MQMLKKAAIAAAVALWSTLAIAQTNPGLTQGQKLTPAQWNALFASKQDTLGYTPLNILGGTMSGRLVTAAPGASTSGLNLTPGSAPAGPADGDLWVTASGIFARVNGVTLDLYAGVCPTCAVKNATNTFTAAQILNLNAASIPTASVGTIFSLASPDATPTRLELTTAGSNSVITGRAAGGTLGAPTTLTAGTTIFDLNSRGYDGTAWASSGSAGIHFVAETTWTNASHPTEICLSTTPVGSLTPPVADNFCIHQDGGATFGTGIASQGTGTLNLLNGLYNNGVAPTGTLGYVRASGPTIANPTFTGSVTAAGLITNAALAGSITASKLVGTDITTVGTLTAGATGAGFTLALGSSTITGQLGYANGGCNATTQVLCRNNVFPTPTRAGDIAFWNGTIWTSLPGNNSGTQAFVEDASGVPSWATIAGTGTVTSAVIAAGTGLSQAGTCTITSSGTCTLSLTTPAVPLAGNSGNSMTGLFDISNAAAGQVKFPSTQNASANANTLDDYREGTFTPTFVCAGCTFSYAAQTGVYTKIGSHVSFSIDIRLNTTGNTLAAATLTIAGLPFTSAANYNGIYPVKWNLSTTNYILIEAALGPSSTTLTPVQITTAFNTNANTGNANAFLNATSGTEFIISGEFIAAN